MASLDITGIAYLVFRLAPFILICYFCLSSFFQQDLKALFYLAGLLISCFLCALLGKATQSTGVFQAERPLACNTFSLSQNATLSAWPLGVNVISYTLGFLTYINVSLQTLKLHWPSMVFLTLLILGESLWNISYECYGWAACIFAVIVGLGVGYLWGLILNYYSVTSPQYMSSGTLTNQQTCSQPSKQLFKCKNVNIKKTRTEQQDGGAWQSFHEKVSKPLMSKPYKVYGATTPLGQLAIPNVGSKQGGVFLIMADAASNEDPNGLGVFMIIGSTSASNPNTTVSLPINPGTTPYFSCNGLGNGKFTMQSSNSKYSEATISYLPIYSIMSQSLWKVNGDTTFNPNTKTGGAAVTVQPPFSGIYLMVLDGGGLDNVSLMYPFYAATILEDTTHPSYVNPVGLNNQGVVTTGSTSGEFSLSTTAMKATNYSLSGFPLYVSSTPMLQSQSFNINTASGGSATTFTVPTSGLYCITVDCSGLKDLSLMYSFYVLGAIESSTVVFTQEIVNVGGLYTVTGKGNGQFEVVFAGDSSHKSTSFQIYYTKLYL